MSEAVTRLKSFPYCTCNQDAYLVSGDHRETCPSQWVDEVVAELDAAYKLLHETEDKAKALRSALDAAAEVAAHDRSGCKRCAEVAGIADRALAEGQ